MTHELEQIEELQKAALDPLVPVETVQAQLVSVIGQMRGELNQAQVRVFLGAVAVRASLAARRQGLDKSRATMFAALVAAEVETL